MTCYYPIPAFRVDGTVTLRNPGSDHGKPNAPDLHVPCGTCLGCLERRARDWSLRCMHEAQGFDENCFCTFTYGRDQMPPGCSLEHRDFQLFFKRLSISKKRRGAKSAPRFFMCGEYGPTTMRPHYHAILFNCDFRDRVECGKSDSGQVLYESEVLNDLWRYGRCTVQDCTPASIAYCTRYCVDKFRGSAEDKMEHYGFVDPNTGEVVQRKPEYMACSKGIGAKWFAKYGRDVFPHDFAVFEGQKYAVPKYYNRLNDGDLRMDEIEFRREVKARSHRADQTPERLAVREIVHKARVRSLKRLLDE